MLGQFWYGYMTHNYLSVDIVEVAIFFVDTRITIKDKVDVCAFKREHV